MRLDLSFDRPNEAVYRKNIFNSDIKHIRMVFILFTFLYLIYGYADYILHSNFPGIAHYIRFFVIIPFLIFTYILSYTKIFFHIYQYLMAANFLVAGAGMSMIIFLNPYSVSSYGGIFMVIFGGFFLLRLRFKYAFISGLPVIFFTALGLYLSEIEPGVDHYIIYSLFVFSFIIGAIGNYQFEKYSRKNFLINSLMEEEKEKLSERVKMQVKEIYDSHTAAVIALAKLEKYRDKNTGGHIERCGEYCQIIAENLNDEIYSRNNLDKKEFVNTIKIAAILHDIGKIGIPDDILNKSEGLSEEEFEIIRTHTVLGSNALSEMKKDYPDNRFLDMGIRIARYHHEWYDGSGYPEGLKGEKIPLEARIMAVVDVFDALRSERPYKPSYSCKDSSDIILESSGIQFDPDIVKVFFRVLREGKIKYMNMPSCEDKIYNIENIPLTKI